MSLIIKLKNNLKEKSERHSYCTKKRSPTAVLDDTLLMLLPFAGKLCKADTFMLTFQLEI
jgi:hypothetical protein